MGCHSLVSELRYTITYSVLGIDLGYAVVVQCLVRITWRLKSDTSFTAWYQSLGIRIPRELELGIHHHLVWFDVEFRYEIT